MKRELFLDASKLLHDKGELFQEKKYKNYSVKHYKVEERQKKELKREMGDYFTILFDENVFSKEGVKSLTLEVEKILRTFLQKYNHHRKVLIVGLGNPDIDADRLGVSMITSLVKKNENEDFLSARDVVFFSPNSIIHTGIDAFSLLTMLVNKEKPELIIVVDSLMTKDEFYVNRAIEISDTGYLSKETLRGTKEITKDTFNIPILLLGVPLLYESGKKVYGLLSTHQEVDVFCSIFTDAFWKLFF